MADALAVLEFDTIPDGIMAGDAMAKRSPVELLRAGTVHPGRFLVLVTGSTAEVEEAVQAGLEVSAGVAVRVSVLRNVDVQVVDALRGVRRSAGEALGIIQSDSVAAMLDASDAGVKAADVILRELRLADDLGGTSYVILGGALTEVEAAVEIAVARIVELHDLDPTARIVTQIEPRMDAELAAEPRFHPRVRTATEEGH